MRYLLILRDGKEFYVDADNIDDAIHHANEQFNIKAMDVSDIEEVKPIQDACEWGK